jgi:hypothetical protein
VVFKFIRSRFATPLSIAYPWILRRGSGRVREVENERDKWWEERSDRENEE